MKLFKVIGFIPQVSQGIFSDPDKKTYLVNAPFKESFIETIEDHVSFEDSPIVMINAYFENLEDLLNHFRTLHLNEMLTNDRSLQLIKEELKKIKQRQSDKIEVFIPDAYLKRSLYVRKTKRMKLLESVSPEHQRKKRKDSLTKKSFVKRLSRY